MLRKMFYIAGGLFLTIALLGSMGLGAWTYNLNTKLEKSQADYGALQSKYNNLDSEYSQSKTDYESKLDQSQKELEEAQAQITKLERDLDQAESRSKSLENKISTIQGKVAVLNAFWFTSESSFASRVEKSDDEQLKKLYKTLGESDESNSWNAFVDLMSYLIESISETSGLQWNPTVNAARIGHHG
jgi:peptidoglycan hydrolase CwlO-like protein